VAIRAEVSDAGKAGVGGENTGMQPRRDPDGHLWEIIWNPRLDPAQA
jgi:hypothetical protein